MQYRPACNRLFIVIIISGGQTGEWALVQEEQMGPLLTPGKKFTKQIKKGIININ